MHKKVSATLLAGIAWPMLCQAAGTNTMQEIVVTATRYEDSALSIPANISIITSEDIQKSTAQNVPDILRTQTGIQVTDITGNKRSFRVDLRGFGETAQSNTLVLIDGRKMNQPDISGSDWSLIPLERVDRIEIVRGGRGSVLYGDNAAGGVVNIITKSVQKNGVEGTVAGGSYNTFKAAVFGASSVEKVSVNLFGGYSNTDGYRQNSASETKDAGMSVTYNANDRFSFSLSSGYHDDSTRLPGALKESDFGAGMSRTDSKNLDDFADTEDSYIKIKPELFFGSENLLTTDISYRSRQSQAHSSGTWGSFLGDTEISTLTFSPQLLLKQTLMGKANTFTFGFDYLKAEENILNSSDFFGTVTKSTYELEKKNTGYYLHEELEITDKTAISGGARYDRATFSFSPSTPAEAIMDETLYTLGINHSFSQTSRIYGTFSRSYRYPVIDELFNFITSTIDTNLAAQTSDDFEIGAHHSYQNGLALNCSLFHITTDNEIFYNASTFANMNMDGKTRRQGVELGVAKVFSNLSLEANYTYMNAEVKGGLFAGHDIPSVPSHKASLIGTYSFSNGLMASLNAHYVGQRPFESDFAATTTDQDDYLVMNAKLLYKQERYSLFLDVNNLTNEKYSEFGGLDWAGEKGYYPSPEVNAILGASFRY